MRFGRGRAESTTRKYAEAIALYLSYCANRSADWAEPDITAFQMWLRVVPPHGRPDASSWCLGSAVPARGGNHINLISYAVCEMFKFAATEGLWRADKLGLLFETTQVRIRSGDRRHASVSALTLRRRHRLRTLPRRRRDAPVEVFKALIGVCQNSRDVFLLAVRDDRPPPRRSSRSEVVRSSSSADVDARGLSGRRAASACGAPREQQRRQRKERQTARSAGDPRIRDPLRAVPHRSRRVSPGS